MITVNEKADSVLETLRGTIVELEQGLERLREAELLFDSAGVDASEQIDFDTPTAAAAHTAAALSFSGV